MARLITTDTIQSLFNPVTVSLVGHWPLNEGSGTTLNDLVNGYDLELEADASAAAWDADTPGVIAGAGGCISGTDAEFRRGGDDEVVVLSPELPYSTQPRTICFWSKSVTTGGVSFSYAGSEVGTVHSRIIDSGRVFGDFGSNTLDATEPISSGTWEHYALVLDERRAFFYRNGVFNAFSNCQLAAGFPADLVRIVLFGTLCKIKDLRIYNGVLTPAEIAALAGV